MDRTFVGYDYIIKSNYINKNFSISVNNDYSINKDGFLISYYLEKYNSSFSEFAAYIIQDIKHKYQYVYRIENISDDNILEIEYRDVIPKNYGKIPSIDELEDLIVEYYKKRVEYEDVEQSKMQIERWKKDNTIFRE